MQCNYSTQLHCHPTQSNFANENPALAQRGIAAVAHRAGWRRHTYHGRSGWIYPICNRDGQVITTRWKAAPGQGSRFKYAWPDGKPDDPAANWYFLPRVSDAIDRAGGVCWLANGEPAQLAMVAAEVPNVISTTHGEMTTPMWRSPAPWECSHE